MHMNSIKRFKNLLTILMLYASNLIIHDNVTLHHEMRFSDVNRRITGREFPKLTSGEKI